MRFKTFLFMSALIISASSSLSAAFTFQDGCIVDVSEVATFPVDEHFDLGSEAISAEDWSMVARQFTIITRNFPTTSYAQEGYYYLGVAYFYLEEYDQSNQAFSEYLKMQSNPRFFQESIEYKFAIADKLSNGAKRRLFGWRKLPKWACGKAMALQIYDEVIAAVPCHEIAASALIAKGYLLWCDREYRLAVDAFNMLIRRFPKHELAPECYLLISKVYLDQSRYEFQNPDILAFAEINCRRFQRDFPRDERICDVKDDVMAIKELYAKGLFEIGQFYERTCKRRAAIIYYHDTIDQFPDTAIAELSRARLEALDPGYCESVLEDNKIGPSIGIEEDPFDFGEE